MDDATLPVPITNHEAVTRIYGRWPMFHDAEVQSVRIESRREVPPSLELAFVAFEMTGATDAAGYYVTKNQAHITLRFDDVRELEIDDVMPQNVLFGIELMHDAIDRNRIRVVLDASVGLGAKYSCASVGVLGVTLLDVPQPVVSSAAHDTRTQGS